jgi:hypothetical protein
MHKFIRRAVVTAILTMTAGVALADPSGRVGRLSALEGQVSFRSSAQADAEAASLNWPLTSMNTISTGKGRAELRVGSAVVQLNADTQLEVVRLTDDEFRLRLHYGSIHLNLRNPQSADDVQVETRHGLIRPTGAARLRIDAELTPETTAVTLLNGAAELNANGAGMRMQPGSRVEINAGHFHTVQARSDNFDDWSASRERLGLGDPRSASARYVSPEITGYEELDRNGQWRMTDDVGPVWTPQNVAADWAPYTDGRWTWVEPWGWTWVDNAPWAYAPSHYGRWVFLEQRWRWAPGSMVGRPVWAPALVGWVGGSGSSPGIGWFPLAPREVYVPHYKVSSGYTQRLNYAHVQGNTGYAQQNHAYRYAGTSLTTLPQSHFDGRRSVVVSGATRSRPLNEQSATWQRDASTARARQQERSPDNYSAVARPPAGTAPVTLGAIPPTRNVGSEPHQWNQRDMNRDGIHDRNQQRDMNRDGIPDRNQRDVNRDSIPDRNQRDMNRDGIPDRNQRDLNRDGIPDRNQRDLNRDGIPDGQQRRAAPPPAALAAPVAQVAPAMPARAMPQPQQQPVQRPAEPVRVQVAPPQMPPVQRQVEPIRVQAPPPQNPPAARPAEVVRATPAVVAPPTRAVRERENQEGSNERPDRRRPRERDERQ